MSRVAKNPVVLPKEAQATLNGQSLLIKGPLGQLSIEVNSEVSVQLSENVITFAPASDSRTANAQSGTARALVSNMVTGVTKGFERKLLLVGVGYKAAVQGAALNLSLGFSHPVIHKLPEGIKAETPTPTEILIKGIDRQKVGEVAAKVRGYRPPEPYKGKGVRYSDEHVVIKETKKK
jgi:large subunit ribosomal protein L6